jgi:hypothetical protein
LAVILSAQQVDSKIINTIAKDRKEVEHIYESDLCRLLVLWAWTRNENQIVFEPDAIDECLIQANRLCGKFHESLPLIDRGTTKFKIARLAVGLAARLFSTTKDLQSIRVCKSHITYIADYIDRIYSDQTFGYADYSKAQEYRNKILDPKIVEKNLLDLQFAKDMVEHLLHADEIQPNDLCDWGDLDRDSGQKLLSLLVRKHAIYRNRKSYSKSSEFIGMLKRLQKDALNQDESDDSKY